VHGPEVPEAHHLCDAVRVVAVRLHRPGREEALRVPALDADGVEARRGERTLERIRLRAGLQPHDVDLRRPGPQPVHQWTGLARQQE
jgi:hypothetical protein